MELHWQQAGPQGRQIIERDMATMSTAYTREYPLVVERAEGSEVWDVDGRRYIDFMAGIGVLNVGHRHPYVVEAVKAQIDKFWHICLSDFYYPQAVELAEKLQAIAPMQEDTRFYLGNSGTEAVEAAIKLAMYHTGRNKFIGFFGGFHGRTLGALAFTGSKAVQRAKYRLGLHVEHVPFPDAYRPVLATHDGQQQGAAVIDYLENHIFQTTLSPTEVAAVLVEPIQGEGGYVIPTSDFFLRLRQMCDEHGILLITDEIQSGIGRTGRWWAIEHEEVEPDIVCFAKGVASGMPIGGIMARESLMTWKPGAHGSTFGGNPIAAAAATATLEVIEKEGLLARAEEAGQFIMDALLEMQSRHLSMGDVRGRGLMIGVEFVKDRKSKERAAILRDDIVQRAFNKGLLLMPCGRNTIRLIPSLNTPQPLIEAGLKIFAEAVVEAEKATL